MIRKRKLPKIFAFILALISVMNFFSFRAEAAQVFIDSSVNTADSHNGINNSVFTSTDTGYVFYRDSGGSCVYSKTLNGGATWGTAVTVDSQGDCFKISVWYDQWTPGDNSGTYIYIVTADSGADDLWFNRLDSSSDTLLMGTSPVAITSDKANTFTAAAAGNTPSIVKATDGEIFAAISDGGNVGDTSYVKKCSASCNLAGSWSDAGTVGMDTASSNNQFFLMPLSGGNIMAIGYDTTPNDIISKVYTDSTSTWDAAWTIIDGSATINNTYDFHMGAGLNKSTGTIYLAYATSVATLGGADDDIRTASYSSGTWTNKTDAITNSAGGITGAKITVDSAGAVYAVYTVQTTANTASTGNIYWKKSIDGMTTWNTESGPVNSLGSDDIFGAKVAPYSNSRIFVNWFENTEVALFGETITLVDSSSPSSANYKLDSYGFGAGGSDNMTSTNYKLNGMLGDVAGAQTTTIIAKDQFTRTSSSSWGSADTGGSYTLSGTASNFNVNGSEGTMSVSGSGVQIQASLTTPSSQDQDIRVKVKSDKLAVGGTGQTIFILARYQASYAEYRARLRFNTTGTIDVLGQHYIQSTGVTTDLGAVATVSGLTHAANTYYWVRSQFLGTNPTTINIKAWADGSPEPDTWNYTNTNSQSELQGSGGVAILSRLSTGTTNGPVVFTYDDYTAVTSNSLQSGVQYTLQSNVPNAPTVSNPSNYYNKLNVVVNTSDNPTDAKYAIAVSSDNFASDIKYVQSDNAIGSTLGTEDWQTYALWGGTSGVNVLGLSPGITYSFRVAAKQGNFTETGYGQSAQGITSNPSLSFDIDIGLTSSVDTNPPYSLDIGTLDPGTVVTGTNKIWFDIDTNGTSGAMIYVKGTNNGLLSSTTSYTIASTSSDLSLISEGYGAKQYSVGQTSGGPLQPVSPYDGSGNVVGTVDTSKRIVFDTSAQPIIAGRAGLELQAKASNVAKAATDYSDTLTVVVASGY